MTTMKAFISSSLFISPPISIGHPVSASGAQGIRPPAVARASTTQQPADGGWPRAYVTFSGARLVIDEPQIARWLDQKRMAMYAAVSSASADESSTALGAQRAGPAAAAPTVFVRRKPAELALLNDVAAYTPVMGTHLEWVSNTNSDGLRLGTTDTVHSLISRRWFGTPRVATTDPPDAFKKIPLEGPRARVPIVARTVACAVNSDKPVFHAVDFYQCFDGIRFGSKPTFGDGARYGPWTGVYTRGSAVYGPYGGAGYAARYNPRTGTYARGAAAWGPGGARGTAEQRGNQWALGSVKSHTQAM